MTASTFGATVAVALMAWRAFAQLDRTLSKDVKAAASARLVRVRDRRPRNTWSQDFGRVFDGVFGDRHLTLRCFARSSSASLLVVIALLIVWSLARPDEIASFAGSLTASKVGVLLVFLPIVNLVPDYISLLQTRWILARMGAARNLGELGLLLAVNAILAALCALTFFVAVFRLGLLGVALNFVLVFVASQAFLVGFGLVWCAHVLMLYGAFFVAVYLLRRRLKGRKVLVGCVVPIVLGAIASPHVLRWGHALGLRLLELIGLLAYGRAWLRGVDRVASVVGLDGPVGVAVVTVGGTILTGMALILLKLSPHRQRGTMEGTSSSELRGDAQLAFLCLMCLLASFSILPSFGEGVLPVHGWVPGSDGSIDTLERTRIGLARALALKAEEPGTLTTGVFVYSTFFTSVWIWASAIGGSAVQTWVTVRRGTSRFLGVLDVSENPFGSIGFSVAILIIVAWAVLSLGQHVLSLR